MARRIEDQLRPDTTYKVAFSNDEAELEKPRFVLAYWSIRGLGAPLRMMLSAAQGVNHWVILYDVKGSGKDGWDKKSYQTDKAWLKNELNPLMNLPFLVDCVNQRVLVQTDAIFLFLGRELGMLGTNALEQSMCEEVLFEVMDLRNQMVRFAYGGTTYMGIATTNFEVDKADAETLCKGAARQILDKLELYLQRKLDVDPSSPRCHLVGDTFTAPDFHLWEMLDQYETIWTFYELDCSPLPATGHLKTFKTEFEALPQNKSYFDSDYSKIPFNNPYARFGSNPETKGQYQRGMKTPWTERGVVNDLRRPT